MNNKPLDPRFSTPNKRIDSNHNDPFVDADEYGFERLNEAHAWIMVAAFFVSAFTIYSYFNRTLITVLETSQLFVIIGLVGFFITYLIRKPLQLSILDGLFYNLFGTAPLGLAFAFVLNAQCSNAYVESYRVVDRESGGNGYTCVLENNALDEYWHIRNLDKHERNSRGQQLEFTFCQGIFGYRVMLKRDLK